MALIRMFVQTQKQANRVHDEVECGWTRFDHEGQTYLQLDTYGSRLRQIPGKTSQSIQLDVVSASELLKLIRQTFPTATGS
jgi:hypothetical protein